MHALPWTRWSTKLPERTEELTGGNQLHVNPTSRVGPNSYLVTDLKGRHSSEMQLVSRKHLTVFVYTYRDVLWDVLTCPQKSHCCLKQSLRGSMGKPNHLLCEDYGAREMCTFASSTWKCCYIHLPLYLSLPWILDRFPYPLSPSLASHSFILFLGSSATVDISGHYYNVH